MRVCVAVAEKDAASALKASEEGVAGGADLIEVRFDAMASLPDEVDQLAAAGVPTIATLRSRGQGGEWQGSDEEKLHFLQKAVRSGFAYVDLEHDFPLLSEAPRLLKGAKLIISYHDFERTPRTSAIVEAMVSMAAKGDIVKVAYRTNGPGDVLSLVEAAQAYSATENEFLAIGMGEIGGVTRALHDRIGSSFTYASLQPGKEVAPGQIDLASLKRLEGDVVITGVCGQSLSHSLSPWMHNAAYKDLDIPGRYFKFQSEKHDLPNLLDLIATLGIRGSNITIPYKEEIIQYLDRLDPEAERIGAVNTVKNEDGEMAGYNTDVYGVEMTFQNAGIDPEDKVALVMGAGGAARSVCAYLSKTGARIVLANRTKDKAKVLADRFTGVEVIDPSIVSSRSYDIVVNCTPLGMKGYPDQLSVQADVLGPGQFVMDTIYNPARTRLVAEAEAKGAKAVSGKDMLIYQAMKAFDIWTGATPRFEVMAQGFEEGMNR
ncbi:MAG: Shikimate dehydrogenase [Methanomassiliicoccales archaeon PtaU1.Bin124]|nr:MAG: Shikimate dehydrogenase [Methanomassiliicoccales archaeon PtaU1.Bin124]